VAKSPNSNYENPDVVPY